MSLLTSKQQEELNYAIADYLKSSKFSETWQVFLKEAQLTDTIDTSTAIASSGTSTASQSTRISGLLEKKWTSVIRLQKKVMELESKLRQAEDELSRGPSGGGAQKAALSGINQFTLKAPEKLRMSGHRAPIISVAFHSIYGSLASASEDCTVRVWDLETGEAEHVLKGHTKAVQCVSFDPKGKFLVSCSADLSVKVWDVDNDYACKKTLYGHDHTVSGVAVHPDGEFIISVSRDKSIKKWEVSTGFCLKTFHGHDNWVRCIDFSEDGRYFVTGSDDQTVRVWNFETGEQVNELRGHEHVVECVKFLPALGNQSVLELVPSLQNIDNVKSVEAKKSPQFVISGSRDRTIKLWSIHASECLFTFKGHENWVRSLCVLARDIQPSDKTKTASSHACIYSASDDKSIKVWDLKTGRCIKTILDAHQHFVTSAVLYSSKRGFLMATGSVDNDLKIWESNNK